MSATFKLLCWMVTNKEFELVLYHDSIAGCKFMGELLQTINPVLKDCYLPQVKVIQLQWCGAWVSQLVTELVVCGSVSAHTRLGCRTLQDHRLHEQWSSPSSVPWSCQKIRNRDRWKCFMAVRSSSVVVSDDSGWWYWSAVDRRVSSDMASDCLQSPHVQQETFFVGLAMETSSQILWLLFSPAAHSELLHLVGNTAYSDISPFFTLVLNCCLCWGWRHQNLTAFFSELENEVHP